MLKPYEDALRRLEERGRLRRLALPAGHDFTSNDYLALANSQELKDAVRSALDGGVAIGAGGSRLLRGEERRRGRGPATGVPLAATAW